MCVCFLIILIPGLLSVFRMNKVGVSVRTDDNSGSEGHGWRGMSANRRLMVFGAFDRRLTSELPPLAVDIGLAKAGRLSPPSSLPPDGPSTLNPEPPSPPIPSSIHPPRPRDTKIPCPPRTTRVGCLRTAHTLSPSAARWRGH